MELSQHNRYGEKEESFHPKSSRIFRVNEFWFFHTREEGILGPFKTEDDAEQGVRDYLQDLLEKNMIHAA